ncbi:hypothetical protein JOF56_003035 [Kibdelosporangium banguiense]|uniref:Uncharacterized protein n=1 Tax=Kibdelosporangium banguiense TaxID=1365924 RepID=A0ABS4TE00_9PSEU|nr:hypothetical protein [Kibdelosporangium banguiense]
MWIEDALTVVELLWWGAFGGLGVEASELFRAVRRVHGVPWKAEGEPSLGAHLLSAGLRLFIGCGLATAAGLSEQVNGPMGALAVGVCAPLIIDQIGSRIPVAGDASAVEAATSSISPPSALAEAEAGGTGA